VTTTHSERLHGLDAVRGFALLAGVVLHAALSFLPGFGEVGWPIIDNSPSATLGLTFFVIHIFRMTMFFVVAGFFGRLLLQREGVRGFVRNRAKRIVLPMVAFWIVVMPLIVGAMIWGGYKANGGAMPPPQPLPDDPLWFPLGHLWFLYVLVWLYTGTLLVRAVVERVDRGGRLRDRIDRTAGAIATSWWGFIALATPLAIALATYPGWSPWAGIPTPDQRLIPNLPATVAFGTAFAFGWLVHRQIDVLRTWERRWAVHAVFAVVFTVACLALAGEDATFTAGTQGSWMVVYAASYAAAVWSWSLALLGAALRFFAAASPVRRYIADSSYWIYLMHLPLVFFLQVAVQDAPLHWSVKFPLILGVALGLLFASYHYLVRPTFIGALLNGRRYPRRSGRQAASPSPAPPAMRAGLQAEVPAEAPQVLASLHGAHKRFGTTVALAGVDLDVRRGELLALLGPNGAGKTTAISLLLGLREPDAGEVRLCGGAPGDIESRYQVGVMMQDVTLAPELRVRELIALVASYYPNPHSVDEVLRLTHLETLANRPYAKLSGGQKRLAQFAVAVCGRPRLLFLDEPTVGLDVEARATLWATIRQLIADGVAIVLTTHYLEEAEALADRVVVLNKGRIIASGSVDEIRGVVARKHISCRTALDEATLRMWPGVLSVNSDPRYVHLVVTDADAVVRQLLAVDPGVSDLEVSRAGLSEAFSELTKEAA
jgi:ABC-type multidrug transport system ATPase subunit/peptidoglycan/LPS O-acetylase OafA/YrhL